jgi:hypothetical protein
MVIQVVCTRPVVTHPQYVLPTGCRVGGGHQQVQGIEQGMEQAMEQGRNNDGYHNNLYRVTQKFNPSRPTATRFSSRLK